VIVTARRARWVLVVVTVATVVGCGRPDLARDLDDPTPPTTSLSAAGTLGHASYIDIVDGARLRVVPGAEVTLLASATDPDGVRGIEIWVTEVLVCPNGEYVTSRGAPPLVPAPGSSRYVRTTSPPSSLTTSFVLSAAPAPTGCAAEWRVRAAGVNAARAPITSAPIEARIGLDPLVTPPGVG
jgi:hypothetical protein